MIIELSAVTCDRDPPSREDCEKLQDNIAANGLQVPLLLNKSLGVIDGLRRLQAIRNLGWKVAAVNIVDDFDAAIESLQMAHHVAPSYRRMYEIHEAVRPMGMARLSRARSEAGRKARRRGAHGLLVAGEPIGSWQKELADALMVSGPILQCVITLYRRALHGEDGSERDIYRKVAAEVESGTLTPSSALTKAQRLLRNYEEEGSGAGGALSLDEQRLLLTKIAASLEGLFHAVDGFTPDPRLGRGERERELRKLRASRLKLNRLIQKLETKGGTGA